MSLPSHQMLSSIRSLAVVSGKGGSGKTLIATAIAQALSLVGQRVLLVDADLGTGGLTYYLGFSLFNRARLGLVDFLLGKADFETIHAAAREDAVRTNPSLERVSIVPVGQHRLFASESQTPFTRDALDRLLGKAFDTFDIVIFDCRGGIDEDSLAVCQAVDSIFIVAETDAASIKTTQHLVDQLGDHDLQRKIIGFVLNKVMDDPTSLATAALSFFRSEYLGPIPFDIEVTRNFIKGEPPSRSSLFARHVFRATSRIFEAAKQFDTLSVMQPAEFSTITLQNPNASRGALIIGMGMAYLIAFYLLAAVFRYLPWGLYEQHLVFGLSVLLFVLAQSVPLKQRLGELMQSYFRLFRRR